MLSDFAVAVERKHPVSSSAVRENMFSIENSYFAVQKLPLNTREPPSLPLSSPPSLPSRAGEDGGVNNAEICVSVPHSFNGPCFQDLGLPLTASKIKANILKSPFYSDVT